MTDASNEQLIDKWIKEKIGDGTEKHLNVTKLKEYQLSKIKDTVSYAKAHSGFYRALLKDINAADITDFMSLRKIPFTTGADIENQPNSFVCVPQNAIHRIVTLHTSGTTGPSKRIFFTEEDQELTKDYFHHGMRTIVGPGDRVLILMPGARPGSIGDLLHIALKRFDCQGMIYGLVDDYDRVLHTILKEKITGIVGLPSQVYQLARLKEARYPHEKTAMKSILLSADYASVALVNGVKSAFQCKVYDHYGMTEMGLGVGLDCHENKGYHLREADMYFEIIDPDTKEVLPDGSYGEVVFTTLTRKGMPLIRYRTGDYSRFSDQPCPCGTKLKTMEKISARLKHRIFFHDQTMLTINMLDDALFHDPRLLDFKAVLTEKDHHPHLTLYVKWIQGESKPDWSHLYRLIHDSQQLTRLIREGNLSIAFSADYQDIPLKDTTGKRSIIDLRNL